MPRVRNFFSFLLFTLLCLSCTSQPPAPTQTSLYLYRFDPAAFVEFSSSFQPMKEIPFSIPPDCSLLDVYPSPVGPFLLVELNCPSGQTVLFLDTDSSAATQPVTDTDSHFLAWAGDGRAAYLKVDSLGDTHLVRVSPNGGSQQMAVTGWTYDLSARPGTNDFIFSFSPGLGSGSELSLTTNQGRTATLLYADQLNYISFARYSPEGCQIAFIKIPDSGTPFTVGELWVMDADGSNPRKLAEADAGHGYAANWSPDGSRIAFVKRENPEAESANQSPESLISNVYLVDVLSGELRQVSHLTDGYAGTPLWSPDGNTLAFPVVLNGRMEVQIAQIQSGQIRSLLTESTCCPAWLRK